MENEAVYQRHINAYANTINHRKPHIDVTFNDTVKMLDICSAFSLIHIEIASKLPNIEVIRTEIRPTTVDNSEIHLLGQSFITVKIGDVKETILVQILREGAISLILETNFLSRFKCIELNSLTSEIKFKTERLSCK